VSKTYKYQNGTINISFLARYPFLDEARRYISTFNIDINDLNKPEYNEILQEAIREIYGAISEAGERSYVDDYIKLMAFPVTLAILSYIGSKPLINRYAIKKAREVEEALRCESDEILCHIANNGLNWVIKPTGKSVFVISFKDYLTVSTMFNDQSWKLINQILVNGLVFLSRNKLIRLMAAGVQKKIMEIEVKKEEPPESIRDIVLKMREKIGETIFKHYNYLKIPESIDTNFFPPCILSIYNDLMSGKSVSHIARFILTTFLVNIGLDIDTIINIFQRVPDYDPAKTRYQVEHIAGMRGGKTKYMTPKCENIKTVGLCLGNCGVKHPINMYMRKVRQKHERKGFSEKEV
jgi:DNA primase large subunit